MSELKPCLMDSETAVEKLQESYDYMTRVMPEGKRSQATIDLLAAMSCAINAIRRSEPANKPLTLEQLRGMDGEPVWIQIIGKPEFDCWGYHDEDGVNGYTCFTYDDDYGKTWIAYRRKPESEEV